MFEMDVRRNDAALENVDSLNKSRKTSCGLQMANLLFVINADLFQWGH